MSKHTPEPWPPFIDVCEPATPHPDSNGIVCLEFDNYRRAMACVNACAGMEDPEAEIAEIKRQNDELLEAMRLIASESKHRTTFRGNAPGHGHEIQGVWDDDNGELAGKKCAWCNVWRLAIEIDAKSKGGAA